MESLKATDQLLNEAVEMLQGLDQALMEHVGAASAPNLNRIVGLLRQMQSKTGHYLESRGYGSVQNDSDSEGSTTDVDGAVASTKQLSGQISSHQDVRKALEMVITFYEQNEPSSPVPLLIKRANRLVGKSFVDIIRDISPGAMPQVQAVSGENEKVSGENKKDG